MWRGNTSKQKKNCKHNFPSLWHSLSPGIFLLKFLIFSHLPGLIDRRMKAWVLFVAILSPVLYGGFWKYYYRHRNISKSRLCLGMFDRFDHVLCIFYYLESLVTEHFLESKNHPRKNSFNFHTYLCIWNIWRRERLKTKVFMLNITLFLWHLKNNSFHFFKNYSF